jgi:phosphoethanolamine N-methyltransferase
MTTNHNLADGEHISKKFASYQEFLDHHQYTRDGILCYEKIFGRGYVSTGGEDTTKEICQLLELKPGQKVLDICCGIGGSCFFMTKTYGVNATGVDLSTNMLTIAKERQEEFGIKEITFIHGDITQTKFDENTFDAVYTRDGVMHIEDKLSLFSQVLKWLKPGGKFLSSDYCAPPTSRPWSPEFTDYVKDRGYFLVPVEDYQTILQRAGFTNIQGWDRKDLLLKSLRDEVTRSESQKDEFLKDGITEEHYTAIMDFWKVKIGRAENGEHVWGVFLSQKPLN